MNIRERMALFAQIRQQWRDRISQPLCPKQAQAAIEALYDYANQQPPKILWVESPIALLPVAAEEQAQRDCLQQELWQVLRDELWQPLCKALGKQQKELKWAIENPIREGLDSFQSLILQSLPQEDATKAVMADCLMPEWAISWAAVFEAATHLGVQFDPDRYTLYCTYLREVGWLFPCEELAIALQRPRVQWVARDSLLDSYSFTHSRIHAEGTPAILYPDGFGVYVYHGIRLPENYGQLHPHQWQSHWLLAEKNAQLRLVLINGIGYGRICQELQVIELDELDIWD